MGREKACHLRTKRIAPVLPPTIGGGHVRDGQHACSGEFGKTRKTAKHRGCTIQRLSGGKSYESFPDNPTGLQSACSLRGRSRSSMIVQNPRGSSGEGKLKTWPLDFGLFLLSASPRSHDRTDISRASSIRLPKTAPTVPLFHQLKRHSVVDCYYCVDRCHCHRAEICSLLNILKVIDGCL